MMFFRAATCRKRAAICILLCGILSLVTVVDVSMMTNVQKRGRLFASTSVCQSQSVATREYTNLCHRYPDVMASASQGMRIALHECQHQFRRHRWNCTTPESSKTRSLHSSTIVAKDYRESAFVHAITAAGVSHAVGRACSMGKLLSCGCGKSGIDDMLKEHLEEKTITQLSNGIQWQQSSWRWSGCNHNIDFGLQISRLLLDSREKAKDIHSKITIHNNRVGRLVVSNNMEIKCKCHGMSGSCELKTCWKASRSFRRVGVVLKDRFRHAQLVDHTNTGYKAKMRLVVPKIIQNEYWSRKQKRPTRTDLVYLQRSPNFCEMDPAVESLGTQGRICNKTTSETDNCDSLCCGKGYNTIRQRRVERCQCRFRWCCHVTCKECVYEEWVTVLHQCAMHL